MASLTDSFEVLIGEARYVFRNDNWLTGYAHFDLASTNVLVRHSWILPPCIRDRDKVAVAGFKGKRRFHAWACRHVDKPADASLRGKLLLRRLSWGCLKGVIPAILILSLFSEVTLFLRLGFLLSAAAYTHNVIWVPWRLIRAAEARLTRELDLEVFD